jgi:putative iron-regulated protein
MTNAFVPIRHGGMLAAIAATAALTAAIFVLPATETDPERVLKTYSDIALAGDEDSLTPAKALDAAVVLQ